MKTMGERDFEKLIKLREALASCRFLLEAKPDDVIARVNERSFNKQIDKVLSKYYKVIEGGKEPSAVSLTLKPTP